MGSRHGESDKGEALALIRPDLSEALEAERRGLMDEGPNGSEV